AAVRNQERRPSRANSHTDAFAAPAGQWVRKEKSCCPCAEIRAGFWRGPVLRANGRVDPSGRIIRNQRLRRPVGGEGETSRAMAISRDNIFVQKLSTEQ